MTDACNLPDAFEAGAAIRVHPDPQNLKTALERFFRLEKETRVDMGLKGRRLAESSYTWKEVAEHMISVYRWLLDGGTAPPAVHEE